MAEKSPQSLLDPEQVVDHFLALAKVNGPSLHEQEVAQVVHEQLAAMGFTIDYDTAGEKLGGNCGNMFAWWEGTDPSIPPLFFSTHFDTVLPTARLKPIIRDGNIYSDGTTILGADDRAALAAYLAGIRAVQQSGIACGPIELILTVCEQRALLGARHLDYSKVRSQNGYIFDSSGDVGQIITRGPAGKLLRWTVTGKQAHLGLDPDKGNNAILIAAAGLNHMKLGKISETTVANVGIFHAGELASIIPSEAQLVGEVRSFNEADLDAQVESMIAVMASAAKDRGGHIQVEVERKYRAWAYERDSGHVQLAIRAAKRIGIAPYFTETLGGADTNIFNEHGLTCITLGNGFREIHTVNEYISIDNVVNTARYVVSLIEEYAATHRSGAGTGGGTGER